MSEYRTQQRGGQGVITIKDVPDRGDLVAICPAREDHELLLMSQDGVLIRTPVKQISCMGRNTMGVRIMKLSSGDRVSSVARVVADGEGNGEGNGAGDGDDGVAEVPDGKGA